MDLIPARIGAKLSQQNLKLVAAESATGGLFAHRITSVAGASAYFVASLVTYATEAKQDVLGVHPQTLSTWGPVSKAVAIEMAQGARQIVSASFDISTLIALSITGYAGPASALGQPVGLVWIGLSTPTGDFARSARSEGSRMENIAFFADQALQWLESYLDGKLILDA